MSDHRATYCPEDNKLRLYVGRVPRDEFEKLRAEGWTTLHKQRDAGGGDFVAIWTPERRDTALEYAGIIEDEDMGPEERAADRAERFGGYRDKRLGEAVDRADAYDQRPGVFGFQSLARGEREVRRYDRMAARACDSWRKADYWTHRTEGVIAHALYKSSPGVRMGRIKTLEAEQRKLLQDIDGLRKRFRAWRAIAAMTDPAVQTQTARHYAGGHGSFGYDYRHPRTGAVSSLYSHLSADVDPISGAEAAALWLAGNVDPESPAFEDTRMADWRDHYALRLAYENQMLQLQGGRAAFLEMEVGGWIGSEQIRKVNRSNATGRVVSVQLLVETECYTKESGYRERAKVKKLRSVNIERLAVDSYRAPSEEDKKALAALVATEKAAAPKVATPPLLNPTDEDAERLQAILNERERAESGDKCVPVAVIRTTQAAYSANSRGVMAKVETRTLHAACELAGYTSNMYSRRVEEWKARVGPALCKVRIASANDFYKADSVIVLTDKPRHSLPAAVWLPLAKLATETAPASSVALERAAGEPEGAVSEGLPLTYAA